MTTESSSRTVLASAKCVHHWLVNPPEGATSWAHCRHCGKRRRFTNRFDGRDRNSNSDLFTDSSLAWKPDRRATYYAPGVAEALEAARLTGLTA